MKKIINMTILKLFIVTVISIKYLLIIVKNYYNHFQFLVSCNFLFYINILDYNHVQLIKRRYQHVHIRVINIMKINNQKINKNK